MKRALPLLSQMSKFYEKAFTAKYIFKVCATVVSILPISGTDSTRQPMEARSATNFQKPHCSLHSIIQSTFQEKKKKWKFKQKFVDYTRRFVVSKMLSVLRSLYRFQTLHKKNNSHGLQVIQYTLIPVLK